MLTTASLFLATSTPRLRASLLARSCTLANSPLALSATCEKISNQRRSESLSQFHNLKSISNKVHDAYSVPHLQVTYSLRQGLHHDASTETPVRVANLVQAALDDGAEVLLVAEQPPQHEGEALDWDNVVGDEVAEGGQHLSLLLHQSHFLPMIFFEHNLFNDEDEEVNQTLVDWQVYSLITSPILTKEKEKVAESVESLHSRLAARLDYFSTHFHQESYSLLQLCRALP